MTAKLTAGITLGNAAKPHAAPEECRMRGWTGGSRNVRVKRWRRQGQQAECQHILGNSHVVEGGLGGREGLQMYRNLRLHREGSRSRCLNLRPVTD